VCVCVGNFLYLLFVFSLVRKAGKVPSVYDFIYLLLEFQFVLTGLISISLVGHRKGGINLGMALSVREINYIEVCQERAA